MRKIFEALSIFDYITPAKGLIEDIYHDPTILQTNSLAFFIRYDDALAAGHNASDIKRELHQAGIKAWGSQITGGELFFSVYLSDAKQAYHVLGDLNVPVMDKTPGASELGSPVQGGNSNSCGCLLILATLVAVGLAMGMGGGL